MRRLLALLVLVLLGSTAWASNGVDNVQILCGPQNALVPCSPSPGGNTVIPGPRIPLGYASTGSFSTATGLPTIPALATLAVIECTAAVNYRTDGTAPTSSVGMPLTAGSYLPLTETATSMASFQMIPQTGSATCNVDYYE